MTRRERLSQRQLALEVRIEADMADRDPQNRARAVERLRELVRDHPHGIRSTHVRHNIGVIRWRQMIALGVLDFPVGTHWPTDPAGPLPSIVVSEVSGLAFANHQYLPENILGRWSEPVVSVRSSSSEPITETLTVRFEPVGFVFDPETMELGGGWLVQEDGTHRLVEVSVIAKEARRGRPEAAAGSAARTTGEE